MDHAVYSMSRAEGYTRLECEAPYPQGLEAETLEDCTQYKCGLCHSEGVAEAEAGATTEGEVGVLGKAVGILWGPAFREEGVGIREEGRVPMGRRLRH